MRGKKQQIVAFTLYPGVTPLDLVGPLTVLRKLGPGWPFRTVVVGEQIEPMATDTSMQMLPQQTYQDVPTPWAVIVPGGGDATLRAMQDDALLAYVRIAAAAAQVVGSTGNGALILAAAGLLEGRRATLHWAYREQLERLGACYDPERWTEDGKFLTAASGSAGIDMLLYFVARYKSEASARLAQLATEYDPRPPFSGIDWRRGDSDVARRLHAPLAM